MFLGLIALLSGFSAVVCEVAWQRELRLLFGATTAASAAVLAVLMLGLGLGAFLFGRLTDRHPHPLALYAKLELGVAASAWLSLGVFDNARGAYLRAGGGWLLDEPRTTAVRLGLAAIMLAIPATLMGGTLPALVAGAPGGGHREGAGRLYGLNTLGAALASAGATFWLLETIGTRSTLWLGCAASALAAAIATAVVLYWPAAAGLQRETEAPVVPTRRSRVPLWRGVRRMRRQEPERQAIFALLHPALLAFVAFTTGAVFFAMELVWQRLLAPLLGGTVYTFGLVLTLILAGIGLGALGYAVWVRVRTPSRPALVVACALEGAALGLPLLLGDRIAVLALALRVAPEEPFALQLGGWLVVAAVCVLPAALVAGFRVALLIGLAGRGPPHVARHVGDIYAANTAGALLGSLATGFWLLPALGAVGLWRLAAVVLALVALTCAWPRPRVPAVAVTLAVLASALLAVGPTAFWRHSPIGAGRVSRELLSSPAELERYAHDKRAFARWQADGREASLALERAHGDAFVINGKIDGNFLGDASTQVMGGLVGAVLRGGSVKRALVIGLGSGSTAGWLAALPSLERVDVVELEPEMVHVARQATLVNHAALDNPKVHIRFGDARELLLGSQDDYDLIFSEPSNPYRAGVASLFTTELYAAARARLRPGGYFLQWLQAYEISSSTLELVYATLKGAFASVETFTMHDDDLLLVARTSRAPYTMLGLSLATLVEPIAVALGASWGVLGPDGFLAHYVGNDALATALAERASTTNTDDRNLLEFAFARSVGASGEQVTPLRALAAQLHADHPPGVEIPRIGETGAGSPLAPPNQTPIARWLANAFAAAAMGHGEDWLPACDQAIRARADAANSTDKAPRATECLALAGAVAANAGRFAEAGEALAKAFVALRTAPWAAWRVALPALGAARIATYGDRGAALVLADALSEPFAGGAAERARVTAAIFAAQRAEAWSTCSRVLAAYEPNVPWDGELLAARPNCYGEGEAKRRAEADLAAYQRLEAKPAP